MGLPLGRHGYSENTRNPKDGLAGHIALPPNPEAPLMSLTVFRTSAASLVADAALAAVPASALNSGTWSAPRAGELIVTGRATGVAPNTEDRVLTAAGAGSWLQVDVSDDYMPHQGFTSFLTDNIAVEAILGATQHEICAVGGTTNVAVHETWVLPPGHHPAIPPNHDGDFQPLHWCRHQRHELLRRP
jgi:outer membrane protein